jgi:hypothetical protein
MAPSAITRLGFLAYLAAMALAYPACGLAEGAASVTPVGSCSEKPDFYSAHNFQVAQVNLHSPFDYLRFVRSEMADALGDTGLKTGVGFRADDVVAGSRRIKERLNATAGGSELRFTIDVVIAELENCHPEVSPPTLEVTYKVFTSWFPARFAPTFESRSKERSDPDQAAGVSHWRTRFIPAVDYNRTTALAGGGALSIAAPFGSLGIEGRASASSTSVSAANLIHHNWRSGWLRNLDWRTGYAYSDSPFDGGRVKRARLFTQFSLETDPSGARVFRFGGAISGGHDQGFLNVSSPPANTSLGNPEIDTKIYVGTSGTRGRQSFKASYGFEIGKGTAGTDIDFRKHVVDAAYDVRFLVADHRAISMETRFGAGVIENLGSVPLSERFFGGNAEQDFLAGDSWRIRSGPYVRSIPQNRLSRLGPDEPFGGENFYSMNFTASFPVWHRPLLPDEMRANSDFRPLLDGQIRSAGTTLRQYWKSKDPHATAAVNAGKGISDEIGGIRTKFSSVEDSVPEAIREQFEDCDFQVTIAEGLSAEASDNSQQATDAKRFNAVTSLVAAGDDGSLDSVSSCLVDLKSLLGEDFVTATLTELGRLQTAVRGQISQIDNDLANRKANRDLRFIGSTVDTLVDETNFLSLSPTVLFDFGRIGPQQDSAGGGTRFGIGAGMRFALLDTLRFTAGYAFNPSPKPWEGRGAAFFSMEITSLFD